MAAEVGPPQELTLRLTAEDAMLLVQTLGAIPCRTVGELAACERAKALLEAIRDQAKAQVR